jgi:anti-sigma B factor antagonist
MTATGRNTPNGGGSGWGPPRKGPAVTFTGNLNGSSGPGIGVLFFFIGEVIIEVMKIRAFKNKEEMYLIKVYGQLDLYTSNQLKELIMRMIKMKIERFIIDMGDVEGINSSGIGAIIYISSTIKKMGFSLAIINIKNEVESVMKLTKLSNYFPLSPSLKDAVKTIRGL